MFFLHLVYYKNIIKQITDKKTIYRDFHFKALANSQISITPSQINVLCNRVCNGSATVSIPGGSAPFNYTWSPSGGNNAMVSGLCAIPYTVMVTDGTGCKYLTSRFVSLFKNS